jgi:hypothetical protein
LQKLSKKAMLESQEIKLCVQATGGLKRIGECQNLERCKRLTLRVVARNDFR